MKNIDPEGFIFLSISSHKSEDFILTYILTALNFILDYFFLRKRFSVVPEYAKIEHYMLTSFWQL